MRTCLIEKILFYIFCHGFFSPKEVRFLKTICDLVSEECEFYHWGDLDYGGICIFQFIKAQVFPKLLPYKMSQEDFELAVGRMQVIFSPRRSIRMGIPDEVAENVSKDI